MQLVSAIMLGGMLWIIARVRHLNLSKPWLPTTVQDTSLTSVVVCYVGTLVLLEFALIVWNIYKVQQLIRLNMNRESWLLLAL